MGCTARRAPSRAALRAHEPLEALPLLYRCGRWSALDDPEERGEDSLDVWTGYRKGRALVSLAQREEAGEQRPAGREDRVHDARVCLPTAGIDRAEARVLPHAVEEAGVFRIEREDVALLDRHRAVLITRERSGLADGGRGEVEAPHVVTGASQRPRVVATSGARNRHARWTGAVARGETAAGLEPGDEWRRGGAELPAVVAVGIERFPERRRA